MDCNYPHWYNNDCVETTGETAYNCCEPQHMNNYPDASFKDRLLGMMGSRVLFSVDARICGRETICGSLCYVGCDFIIVNVCIHRKPISMYIPIHMIRFFAMDH